MAGITWEDLKKQLHFWKSYVISGKIHSSKTSIINSSTGQKLENDLINSSNTSPKLTLLVTYISPSVWHFWVDDFPSWNPFGWVPTILVSWRVNSSISTALEGLVFYQCRSLEHRLQTTPLPVSLHHPRDSSSPTEDWALRVKWFYLAVNKDGWLENHHFNRSYIFKCVFISHCHGSFRGVYTCCLWLDNFPIIMVHWKICPFFVEGRVNLMHSWVKVRYVQLRRSQSKNPFLLLYWFFIRFIYLDVGGSTKNPSSPFPPNKWNPAPKRTWQSFSCREPLWLQMAWEASYRELWTRFDVLLALNIYRNHDIMRFDHRTI